MTRFLPSGGALSPRTLAIAISNTNNRIRSNSLSSKEICLKKDTITNEPLNFSDTALANFKYEKRLHNHQYSAASF